MASSPSQSSQLQSHLLSISDFSPSPTPRLSYLYSSFPQHRASNPQGFSSAIEWWSAFLQGIVQKGVQPCASSSGTTKTGSAGALSGDVSAEKDVLILNVAEGLREGLRWGSIGRPACLGGVLSHLSRNHVLVPLPLFFSTPSLSLIISSSESWSSYLISNLVSKPLWWAFTQLNPFTNPDAGLDDGESDSSSTPSYQDDEILWRQVRGTSFILIPLLEGSAERVISKMAVDGIRHLSLTDRLFTLEGFLERFGEVGAVEDGKRLSRKDLEVLLKFLSRDRNEIVMEKNVIKVPSSIPNPEGLPTRITEEDRGILEIKQSSLRLNQQIEEIERKITDRSAKISSYLRSKQREIALSYLRSKKQLEDLLQKRTSSLETITSVLIKIEQAAGDAEIMRSYRVSTNTLRTLLKDPSLSPDEVDRTMDGLSDVLADHKEIEDAISMGGDLQRKATGVDVDEDEIAKELADMEKEEKDKERLEKEEKEKKEEEEMQKLAQRARKLSTGDEWIEVNRGGEDEEGESQEVENELRGREKEAVSS